MSQITVILIVVVCMALLVGGGLLAKYVVGVRRNANWAHREKQLLSKYQDQDVVEKIMSRMIWKNMTREQLVDSWGRPSETHEHRDENGLREIFRYHPRPGRPHGQRVILDGDRVIGWDTKAA